MHALNFRLKLGYKWLHKSFLKLDTGQFVAQASCEDCRIMQSKNKEHDGLVFRPLLDLRADTGELSLDL